MSQPSQPIQMYCPFNWLSPITQHLKSNFGITSIILCHNLPKLRGQRDSDNKSFVSSFVFNGQWPFAVAYTRLLNDNRMSRRRYKCLRLANANSEFFLRDSTLLQIILPRQIRPPNNKIRLLCSTSHCKNVIRVRVNPVNWRGCTR